MSTMQPHLIPIPVRFRDSQVSCKRASYMPKTYLGCPSDDSSDVPSDVPRMSYQIPRYGLRRRLRMANAKAMQRSRIEHAMSYAVAITVHAESSPGFPSYSSGFQIGRITPTPNRRISVRTVVAIRHWCRQLLTTVDKSTRLNTRLVHHSAGHGDLLNSFAIRYQDDGPRALRLDFMARSRRQCSAPCPPSASTIDCGRSAK